MGATEVDGGIKERDKGATGLGLALLAVGLRFTLRFQNMATTKATGIVLG